MQTETGGVSSCFAVCITPPRRSSFTALGASRCGSFSMGLSRACKTAVFLPHQHSNSRDCHSPHKLTGERKCKHASGKRRLCPDSSPRPGAGEAVLRRQARPHAQRGKAWGASLPLRKRLVFSVPVV